MQLLGGVDRSSSEGFMRLTTIQKYGHVAFDATQKAVLTSCVLRFKPHPSSFIGVSGSEQETPLQPGKAMRKSRDRPRQQEGFINCCFSFTIRRDTWGIPTVIAGELLFSSPSYAAG